MRRRVSRWKTGFGSWVSDYGVSRLIRDLDAVGEPVTNKAVYMWVAGSTLPRPRTAVRLVQLSGGAVSLEDIYRHRALVAQEKPLSEATARPGGQR